MGKNDIRKKARMNAELVAKNRGRSDSRQEHLAYIEGYTIGFEDGAKQMQQELLDGLWRKYDGKMDKDAVTLVKLELTRVCANKDGNEERKVGTTYEVFITNDNGEIDEDDFHDMEVYYGTSMRVVEWISIKELKCMT